MKRILSIAIIALSVSTGRIMADDLTPDQKLSIIRFAEEIEKSTQLLTEVGGREKGIRGALEQDLLHIAYLIIYVAESEQSGENVQAAFTAISEKVGEARVKKPVGFLDERTEILQKLSLDAFKQFAPNSNIAFSPVASKCLAGERTLGELIAIAQAKISKATGFKFKAINPVYQQ